MMCFSLEDPFKSKLGGKAGGARGIGGGWLDIGGSVGIVLVVVVVMAVVGWQL